MLTPSRGRRFAPAGHAPRIARKAAPVAAAAVVAVLVVAVVAACASHPARSPSAASPLPTLPPASSADRELTADQQVLQVLNRLTFGARPGDAAAVRRMGVDGWAARQLDPGSIDDRSANDFIARFPTYGATMAQLETDYPRPARVVTGRPIGGDSSRRFTPDDSAAYRAAQRAANRIAIELQIVKVGRAELSERQLQEVMIDFWENHFSIYDRKGQPMRYYLTSFDRDVVRPHALGKFRELLGAVAKSPAMLFYLDNWESVADSMEPTLAARPRQRPPLGRGRPIGVPAAPQRRRARGLNENYGRELLELHTLGVDGGYTQQDVINVARALTGWSIARPQEGSGFVFRPGLHDAGEKIVLGHTLPAGRGIEDGEDVLDIVARHPSTARYIASKLCRRFVSDTPPPALVARAADTFQRTDGDVRQVLWTIVTSPEFYSRGAYRSKVKSPFEVVVSTMRAIDAAPDTTPRTAAIIARMGEPIFGHQAPNGYPETGESWMNTGAILNRINFGLAVAAQRVPGAALDRWPEARDLKDAPRAAQVDAVVASILGGDASPDTRAILMSGEHPLLALGGSAPTPSDGAAADGGPAGAADPGPAMGTAPVTDGASMAPTTPGLAMDDGQRDAGPPGGREARDRGLGPVPPLQGLAQVVGLALGAPEFQRR
jgi:uncharacterized protein (DUF1800 family)